MEEEAEIFFWSNHSHSVEHMFLGGEGGGVACDADFFFFFVGIFDGDIGGRFLSLEIVLEFC